ncbi:phenylalanine--tRNA ligase subunit beta [Brevibacillus humidisoli]|uniref:phenylalanine--tRNA ligase subunit beta n=1 Tax=Brevibacillus humidisoli TaxID=2895522 RepID=UPI001E5FB09A|nr:phenylalanine--tRNA ligase subunit beta [Brevibacillus humidisoli]UFJ39184.1 phenylalanine--tRNA ligase subunit beta [Brevibacillus humidisoli]
MKVSYQWLSAYVDLSGMTPHRLAELLTSSGIEVDAVESRNQGVENVVIGYVKERSQHPDADRLSVCVVDVGQGEDLQIVCGAKNVAQGQKVPVALPGAKLPGGLKIKRSKLRGVESQGMICSAKELGLNDKLLAKDQQEGIMVLPEEAEVGADAVSYLGLDDYVLELGLTPNRSDCLSMLGVAYEVAAILGRDVQIPQLELVEDGADNPLSVRIEAKDHCHQYHGRHFTRVRIGSSPQWLKNRLMAAGVRPINNVVDVTNYVMLEYGQPLHAFDANCVSNQAIVVRLAEPGEKLVTLDDQERALDEQTLVIADPQKGLAIAGIMGGANSEVTEKTEEIILESAYFTPQSIRRSARMLEMRTEGCVRWEKGVDPNRVPLAADRAAGLIQQLAGAVVSKGIAGEVVEQRQPVVVSLTLPHLNRHLGMSLSPEEVSAIFGRLQFAYQYSEETWHVQIPTRRNDITLAEDLIEEVARLYGYDKIPTTLPFGETTQGRLTRDQSLRRRVRHHLIGAGLSEAIAYSLINPGRLDDVAGLHEQNLHSLRLAMPMSEEHSVLRVSLLPGLLQVAQYNKNRQNHDLAIFELGHVFLSEESTPSQLPEERLYLAGLLAGQWLPPNWNKEKQPVDFYLLKGIVESLLASLGVTDVEWHPTAERAGMHPGRTADIVIAGEAIGYLGQLHPAVEKTYDLEEIYAFQLDTHKLFAHATDLGLYRLLPKFPAMSRDLAFVVERSVQADTLTSMIRQAAGDWLESVTLFDVYTGEHVAADKKSVAFSLVYRHPERTLQDEEVQESVSRIVQLLTEQLGAELRK